MSQYSAPMAVYSLVQAEQKNKLVCVCVVAKKIILMKKELGNILRFFGSEIFFYQISSIFTSQSE